MTIKPLNKRVLLSLVKGEKITRSGIILPNQKEEKVSVYDIISVSSGSPLVSGQKVICSEYSGFDYSAENVKYKLVDEDSLLALYED